MSVRPAAFAIHGDGGGGAERHPPRTQAARQRLVNECYDE